MKRSKTVTHNGKTLLVTQKALATKSNTEYEIAFDIMGNCLLLVNGKVTENFLTPDDAKKSIKEDVIWDYTEQ